MLAATLLATAPLLVTSPSPIRAHDFSITDVVVVFKADGTYQIDLTVDLDALALGAPPGADDGELVAELEALSPAGFEVAVARAQDTILRRVRIRFDGEKGRPTVTLPELEVPLVGPDDPPTLLGTTARLSGRVPDGAEEFSFGASRAFAAVRLTILDQATVAGARYVLGAGEDSPAYRIGVRQDDDGPATGMRARDVTARYLLLGFEHIVPKGLDHILFVVGLYLLSTRLTPLLWQVTAFTVAHSVSLALSMAGVVSLPERLVEPLIAASIAYVAIENLMTTELKPWRPALVFGFGLLHGLGFAGVLRELGLADGEFVNSLVSFNVGVELGQLAVVAAAFALVGWCRDRPWYRRRIVLPASIAIAAAGTYWAFERAIL